MKSFTKVISAILLIKAPLFASDSVVHNVDVISGQLHLSYTDHKVQGAAPIPITRSFYTIKHQRKNDTPLIAEMERIGIFPHLLLYIRKPSIKYAAEVIEKGAGKTLYRALPHRKNEVLLEQGDYNKYCHCPFPNNGYSVDRSRSMISGYRNIKKNDRIIIYREEKKAVMYLANGGERHYKIHGKKRTFLDKICGDYWKIGYQYLLQITKRDCSKWRGDPL